jgi:hypothetical protein
MGSSEEQLGQIGNIAGMGAVALIAVWAGVNLVSLS